MLKKGMFVFAMILILFVSLLALESNKDMIPSDTNIGNPPITNVFIVNPILSDKNVDTNYSLYFYTDILSNDINVERIQTTDDIFMNSYIPSQGYVRKCQVPIV